MFVFIPKGSTSCLRENETYYFYKDDGKTSWENNKWICCGKLNDVFNCDGTVTGGYRMSKNEFLKWRGVELVWEEV